MLSASASLQSHDGGLLSMDTAIHQMKLSSTSSRILDIPCKVCGDFSSGKHYNIFACDGCAGFFKRSIRRNRQYICKAKAEGTCIVDKTHRNQCRACRLAKCQEAGMNKDAVQHERGPRNSTLRRQQMAQLFNETSQRLLGSSTVPVLDLALPKSRSAPPVMEALTAIPSASFICNAMANLPRFSFSVTLPPPTVLPSLISPASTCESAARLIFMNVKWAKNVPSFTALPLADQLLLLEESWRELFVLGSAQFLMPMELGHLTHYSEILERNPNRGDTILNEIKQFQEILSRLAQFHMDAHEFACLRAIVLFKTSFEKPNICVSSTTTTEGKSLSNPTCVGLIQDQTQLMLNKYISTAHPGQPLRFGKLLLLLPMLKNVSGETIEELFFRKTIGNIPIVKIICDMYKNASPDL